jgi:hypothetical protein
MRSFKALIDLAMMDAAPGIALDAGVVVLVDSCRNRFRGAPLFMCNSNSQLLYLGAASARGKPRLNGGRHHHGHTSLPGSESASSWGLTLMHHATNEIDLAPHRLRHALQESRDKNPILH